MAGLTPSLVGLSLKPATWRRVPTGAGGDDNLRKSARSAASHYYHFVCPVLRAMGMPLVGPEGCMVEANKRWRELNEEEKAPFINMNLLERESMASGGNQLTEEQLRALCPESILAEYDAAKVSLEARKSAEELPPPPAPMRAPASTGPVLPLATPPAPGEAGPSTTDVVLQVAQQRDELKRRAEEALAMAGEVKRQKIEAVAAEKEAAARAKAAEKEAAAQAKAAEKAAAAKARAEAKAAADAVKAAEKEAAAQVKAAIKEVAAQAKAAEKEAAVLTKAAEKAEKEAAAEAKAAEKAQEDARDEAEAKMLGISVTTLRVRRTKALKAAKEAGYETVEAHAAVLAAEAAEKAAADATKAAEKEAAAQAKVAEKAAADAAKAAAKAAEKAEKEAAAEAKAAEKAQEDARDEAEAKTLGISVTTLRARRTKALKAAKEAGYETAEAHAAALAAEAAEAQAKAEEAAAAQAAAEAAAKAAAEAEAKRKEREEACAELEEQIHRLRWQQRSMAEDYAQMLKEWEENNCGDAPAWMGEMSTIFQKLSDAIQDAENKNPVMWEISEGGKHAQYADKFADEAEKEAMEVDEADEEGEEGEEGDDDNLPEGYTVTDEAANALAQGKAKGRGKNDDDVDMDVEDDTIQIDLRITLQNVRDNSEEKEKWRTQVIHTDYENGKAAYVTAPDPQPDNPNATKLVRSDKPKEPYPSDIPQEFINDVHAEVNAIERATKGMASAILSTHGGAPASLLASVSAAPMTAFDGTSNPTTQQNMAAPKGKGLMRTLYAVEMHLPANVAASREQANLLVEGFLTATMDDWSNATGLRVVQVSGVQDMESYMEGIFKQQKVQADGPLTKDEIAFMVAKFGPNWKDPEVARPDDRMAFLEMYRAQSKQMDQEQNIKRAVADQRQVGASDADADRVREEAGAGAGPEGGSRRKPGKAAVQRREV